MPRPVLVATALALLVGCESDLPESLPHKEEIPGDAVFIYQFDPNLLAYDFYDSTTGGQFRLTWLPPIAGRPFSGYTCFALTPRVAGDSIGRFVFVARGLNTGYLRRETTAGVDTTPGYFLDGREGSRGTYVLHAQGDLELLWTNGQQVRYFDPTATIRIDSTILSAAVRLRYVADSVSETWAVAWPEGPC